MRLDYTPNFNRTFEKLPSEIRRKFQKQATYLRDNLRHSSLRAKKYFESQDIWQARVDDYYRFYFRIEKDMYILLWIRGHED